MTLKKQIAAMVEQADVPIESETCDWPDCEEPPLCTTGNAGGANVCRQHFHITNEQDRHSPVETICMLRMAMAARERVIARERWAMLQAFTAFADSIDGFRNLVDPKEIVGDLLTHQLQGKDALLIVCDPKTGLLSYGTNMSVDIFRRVVEQLRGRPIQTVKNDITAIC